MFRIKELSLHGWDLWPPIRIPLDSDVVIVTGPNGSGKTTLLDALRLMLNAPRLSSHRRLGHYLRHSDRPAMVIAIVSNEADSGQAQPFRPEGVRDSEVTLACVLIPNPSGTHDKRFVILPGRRKADEIWERAQDPKSWYPVERYGRALEMAGVTRSLLRILAIEQGEINRISDFRPRELFRYVLEMMGDFQVLERYRGAKVQYETTAKEVDRQAQALNMQQVLLGQKRDEVRRRDDWEYLKGRVEDLAERLPATELQLELQKVASLDVSLAVHIPPSTPGN